MKRYKHNFNDGDIVFDSEYNEIFEFSDKTDGFRAEQAGDRLRLATEEETKQLEDGKFHTVFLNKKNNE